MPPLFFVWLFKVGQHAERKLGKKPNKIFRIAITLFMTSFISFIFAITLEDWFLIPESYYQSMFWIIFISFLVSDYFITTYTFELEDHNEEKYSATLPEKVSRFIILSTLIFGAIILQPQIIKMFNKKE